MSEFAREGLLPWVRRISRGLVASCFLFEGLVQVPRRALREPGIGLGPHLVSVDPGRADRLADRDRPEPATTGPVGEVVRGVRCPNEDAAARRLDLLASVGWPVAVDLARDERLDSCRLCALHCVELRHLDEPPAAQMQRRVLVSEVRQVVIEPVVAGEMREERRLT